MKRLSRHCPSRLPGLACLLFLLCGVPSVQGLPLIKKVPYQPFVAATQRLVEALEFCGAPLAAADTEAIERAIRQGPGEQTGDTLQTILDRYCIAGVCWNAKHGKIRGADQVAAKKAYQHARNVYDRIIAESK